MLIAVSPCSNPELELEPVLAAYSAIGYRRFEAFTGWVQSAFHYRADPAIYRRLLKKYGMALSSLHLPPIAEDSEAAIAEAVKAAEFAAAVGAPVVLFKAKSRELYIRTAGRFLDAIAKLPVVPVLQNHANSPISSPADYDEVIRGIGDRRMRTLLEVGHFHSVGVSWREGYDLLGDSIALVHIKDQIGTQSVAFGTGEIDLPGLFARLKSDRYAGDIVVEMEVADRENTLTYLQDAFEYVQTLINS